MIDSFQVLGLLCAAASASPAVQADAIPSGQKGIVHEVSLAVAPDLRERSTFEITILQGDTLSALAQQHLGKASRWQEITALNPSVEPEKLTPGTALLLPASARPVDAPTLHLFVLSHHLQSFDQGPAYLRLHGSPPPAQGAFVVAAVETDHLAEFRRRIRDQRERVQFLMDVREGREECDWLALSEDLDVERTISDASPVQRMRTVFMVRKVHGSQLEVGVERRQRWDSDGNEMSAWAATVRSKVFLAGLGAAGFVGLLLLALFKKRG